MVDLTCTFPFWVFIRCLFQVWALFLPILCMKDVLGKFGSKSRNDLFVIDLQTSILVLISQIIVFDFVHFEYEKVFWNIMVKFILYRVFPSPSWSNKKQVQLVDLVIGSL